MLLHSLVRSIEIIGEAAVSVSPEYKGTSPGIPWAKLVGMRNRLIHAYFDIDADIVWDTTVLDLPPLVNALTELVSVGSGGVTPGADLPARQGGSRGPARTGGAAPQYMRGEE